MRQADQALSDGKMPATAADAGDDEVSAELLRYLRDHVGRAARHGLVDLDADLHPVVDERLDLVLDLLLVDSRVDVQRTGSARRRELDHVDDVDTASVRLC